MTKKRTSMSLAALAAAALLGYGGAAQAQSSGATPVKQARLAKHAPAHAKSEAKPPAAAAADDLSDQVNANQLDISARVLTGRADCEFNQNVEVDRVPDHPGYFHVGFAKHRYVMVPEETTTGAVRLVDKKSGVIWLQIPVKSMLIDTKGGHRLVDACMHSEQRAAVEASKGAAQANSLQ
jgi:hypothetical protein